MQMNTTQLGSQEEQSEHSEHDEQQVKLLSTTDPNCPRGRPALREEPAARGRRPTKLTQERQQRILDALRHGAAFSAAAHVADIAPRTIFRWMARGALERSGAYHEFTAAVEEVLTHSHSHPPQNALSPMQAELFALLARALAATPWQARESFEQELIQLLADKRVIPPDPTGGEKMHKNTARAYEDCQNPPSPDISGAHAVLS